MSLRQVCYRRTTGVGFLLLFHPSISLLLEQNDHRTNNTHTHAHRAGMSVPDPPELVKQLSDDLSSGTYECAVCSEVVTRKHRLWSCRSCYGVFHLPCIAHWAETQYREREKQLRSTSAVDEVSLEGKVRCPLCQALNERHTTTVYTCYCGKVTNPPMDAMLVPGSCGQPCERRHADSNCPHRCNLLCHPGPCPPCTRTRSQACYCGKNSKTVGCSSEVYGYECGQPCGKLMDCGHHHCPVPCHDGPCPVCTVTVKEACYCGATSRLRRCADDPGFRCTKRCCKMRDCGHHECGLLCHPGSCEICLRLPSRQRYCPCGKTLVKVVRTSCLDPVPSCGLPCELPLLCGHLCWFVCHDDSPCAPCKEMVKAVCPCGSKEFTFPCFCQYLPQEEWAAAAKMAEVPPECLPPCYPPKCQRLCRKQLSCHKHKCANTCCTDVDHTCFQICTKKLSCGVHQCGQLCHQGPCPLCTHVSYEPLYCRCRRTWIDPPIPCGTKPPKCNHPCVVPRPCGHPANHPCHIEPECPNCVIPVEKLCASHQLPMPYHMPCYMTGVSCGKKCGKVLPCCGKSCEKVCHTGPCQHNCTQKFPSFAEALKKSKK